MGAPTGWEIAESLMPLLDKYMNNINKIIMEAFKEGMSKREKGELTHIRGEEPEIRERGSQTNPEWIRRIQGNNPDYWKEQLRGDEDGRN